MNISFALTTHQIIQGTKSVTRRVGWENLKPGKILHAIEKGQGLKKGEKVKHLREIRVISVRRESLACLLLSGKYPKDECRREGFPDLTPRQFVVMFCASHKCEPDTVVTRIEFDYVT